MTNLEFVAGIVSSLAWPATVILAVVLLREHLKALVPLLRRLKYKDLEVEFTEQVKELRDEAESALPSLPPSPPPVPEEEAILALVSVSPRSAIAEAWRLVESAARSVVQSGEPGRPPNGHEILRSLQLSNALEPRSHSMLIRLRSLRNQAVHSDEFAIDAAAAREYVQLALAVVRRLRGK